MSVDEDLDEKATIERIRERLRLSVGQAPLPPATPRCEAPADPSDDGVRLELTAMRDYQDVSDVPLRSQRPVLGPLLRLANKVVRRLIAPSLDRQVNHNAANQRLARALAEQLKALRSEHEALRRRCDALQAELDAVRAKIGGS